MGDLETDIRYRAGEIAIDRLDIGSFYGAAIESSGGIEQVLTNPKAAI